MQFGRQEVLTLYLYLSKQYDTLDSSLKDLTGKMEDYVYSNFTIQEISNFLEKNEEGEP